MDNVCCEIVPRIENLFSTHTKYYETEQKQREGERDRQTGKDRDREKVD